MHLGIARIRKGGSLKRLERLLSLPLSCVYDRQVVEALQNAVQLPSTLEFNDRFLLRPSRITTRKAARRGAWIHPYLREVWADLQSCQVALCRMLKVPHVPVDDPCTSHQGISMFDHCEREAVLEPTPSNTVGIPRLLWASAQCGLKCTASS